MNRSIENMRAAVKELNRRESWRFEAGKAQAYEPTTARHLRNIAETLRALAFQHEGERGTIGRLIGRPLSQRAAVSLLFRENYRDPVKAIEEATESLDHLASNIRARRAGESIVELYKAGRIDRLRNCRACRKWFLARRANQRVCNASCRSQLWQRGKGRNKHKRAWRKWWIRKYALERIKEQLEKFPKARPLTIGETRRKEWYLAKKARYEKELEKLTKTSSAKGG